MRLRSRKFLVRSLAAIILIPLSLFALSLSFARVEVSETGVHQRLFMPLGIGGAIKIPLYSGTGDSPALPGFLDGPVVRLAADGQWQATWSCAGVADSRRGQGALQITCGERTHSFNIGRHLRPAPAVLAMPAKLLVLSDIEGNSAYLDKALQNLGVMDAQGAWQYGANHLAIAGDAADRGRNVFAVLWRLHDLSLQAARAGGAVTLVLGNHDQYLLRGNISRAHSDHLYALDKMGGQPAAFAKDTVIGEWLRQQPVMLKVGRVLITHGGVSAAVAAQGVTVDQLNDAMRAYWDGKPVAAVRLDAVVGPAGVTQYRGYFDAMEGAYAKATQADVDRVAAAFDVDTMVVGHSIVEQITPMFGNRVYAIDVNSNTAAPQALLFEGGQANIVNAGAARMLDEKKNVRLRPLRITSAEDWAMLGRGVMQLRALSQIPHPY